MKRTIAIATAALLCGSASLRADVTVEVGSVAVSEGTTSTALAVTVIGGDPLTDMNAVVQVDGGGPSVGAPAAPEVTAVNFSSSIWHNAPGGFVSFFASASPDAAIVDPSVALLTFGEDVTATGTLFDLQVDLTGFPVGDYPVATTGTAAGDTELLNNGVPLNATHLPGTISVQRALDHWRREQFGDAIENPLLESLWGNHADPDLDGLDNLTEFTFGTDPQAPGHPAASPSNTGLPHTRPAEHNGDPVVELTYAVRTVATGLTLTFETSADLATWQTASPNPTQIGSLKPIPGTLYQLRTVRLTNPAPDAPLFVRINLSHAP